MYIISFNLKAKYLSAIWKITFVILFKMFLFQSNSDTKVCPFVRKSHIQTIVDLNWNFYKISNMELTFLGGSAATSNACVQRGSSQRRPPRAESEAFYSILLARTVQLWLHLSITWLQLDCSFLIKKMYCCASYGHY